MVIRSNKDRTYLLKGYTMENATNKPSPAGLTKVTPVQNGEVVRALLDASKGFKGALGKVTQAAQLASNEFSKDKAISNTQRVDSVIATYAPTFALCDSNVKKHFANCLWLLVAPDEQLEISPPKGEAKAVTMRAGDIVAQSSKATIQLLAKEARAANGAGRKVTPKVEVKPKTFFDLLAAALSDKEQLIKVKLTLAAAGYALTPISAMTQKERDALPAIIPAANKITDMAEATI